MLICRVVSMPSLSCHCYDTTRVTDCFLIIPFRVDSVSRACLRMNYLPFLAIPELISTPWRDEPPSRFRLPGSCNSSVDVAQDSKFHGVGGCLFGLRTLSRLDRHSSSSPLMESRDSVYSI